MRLGFACAWESTREATWSGTPLALRTALDSRPRLDLCDLEPDRTRRWRAVLRVAALRRSPSGHGLSSHWRWSRTWRWICQRDVARAARREAVEAVLQIGDLATLPVPTWVYQDLSYASLLPYFGPRPRSTGPLQPALTRATLERKVVEQQWFYERVTGVFAMSTWLERQMHAQGVTCPVTVVPPGRNTPAPAQAEADDERRATRPRRLLAIGVDFERKGIDLAARACALLRDAGRDVELTVAGPAAWPVGMARPAGVTFVGRLAPSAVPALYAAHDVFVLPSRFEPFGIVFTEALAAGLPVVARDAFAMPEIVQEASNGALVPGQSDNASDVADAIGRVLDSPRVFAHVAAARAATAELYSWDRAAAVMHQVIGEHS